MHMNFKLISNGLRGGSTLTFLVLSNLLRINLVSDVQSLQL